MLRSLAIPVATLSLRSVARTAHFDKGIRDRYGQPCVHAENSRPLRPVYRALRHDRDGGGRALRSPRSRSLSSDGAGDLCQGTRRPGAGLSPGAPDPSVAPHASQGRRRSRLGADSWDEALDLTAAALQRIKAQHGAKAVAFSMASASTTAIGDSAPFVRRLMNAFGTPNLFNSIDVCGWGRGFATQYTFGVGSVAIGGGAGAMADIANSGCLILWGYNPSFSRLTHATAIAAALQRGPKLIVIDPRRVGMGAKADVWLRVRPGSDGALALGLANLMIQNGWYDRTFIQTWSNGPLLVRNDNGRLLSARDMGLEGARRYFAWHETEARLVTYDAAAGSYEADVSSLALEGEYRIATPHGEVACRPAFELYAALCRNYPPQAVEATCWIRATSSKRPPG